MGEDRSNLSMPSCNWLIAFSKRWSRALNLSIPRSSEVAVLFSTGAAGASGSALTMAAASAGTVLITGASGLL